MRVHPKYQRKNYGKFILNELEKNNIIKSQLVGKNKYFYLNLDNIEVKYLILNSEIYKTVIFIKKYPRFLAKPGLLVFILYRAAALAVKRRWYE